MHRRLAALTFAMLSLPATVPAAEIAVSGGYAHASDRGAIVRPVTSLTLDLTPGALASVAMRADSRTAFALEGRLRPSPFLRLGAGADLAAPASGRAAGSWFSGGAPRLGYHVASALMLPLGDDVGLDLEARVVAFDRRPGDGGPDRFASRFWAVQAGVRIAI